MNVPLLLTLTIVIMMQRPCAYAKMANGKQNHAMMQKYAVIPPKVPNVLPQALLLHAHQVQPYASRTCCRHVQKQGFGPTNFVAVNVTMEHAPQIHHPQTHHPQTHRRHQP